MSIQVIKPGMLSTVQDLGRWGYQDFGVPAAGPMDRCAHRLANLLVGNPPSAATVEVTARWSCILDPVQNPLSTSSQTEW